MCGRIDNLCNNWDVLISEACSDALMELKEQDEEYAAALHAQRDGAECLRGMIRFFDNPELRKDFEQAFEKVLYEVGTQELRACYLAGAGDGLRLAHQLGLLKI